MPTTGGASSNNNNNVSAGGSFLTKYFLVILFIFACLSLLLNTRFTNIVVQDASIIQHHLENSIKSAPFSSLVDAPATKKAAPKASQVAHELYQDSNKATHEHRISDLNCEKWGGPSKQAAKELIYWEDIPSDAAFMSPFHPKERSEDLTQYMTFEPDNGGWNNIRMAMETVLVRTLLLL